MKSGGCGGEGALLLRGGLSRPFVKNPTPIAAFLCSFWRHAHAMLDAAGAQDI
jgi:hypothetical protein